MRTRLATTFSALGVVFLASALVAAPPTNGSSQPLPRTADGKPNFSGIWQASSTAEADLQDHVSSLNMLAGRSVLAGGGQIPYQPWAASQRAENFKIRAKADPLNQCYIPGTPRIMYMNYPFQIFQTSQLVGITFEWYSDFRLIYTDGSQHPDVIDTWMGDSRGHWEGDTLVVDVAKFNDRTWFDMAGDFHSDQLHVTERYRMTDADTIQYEATMEDPKVFTKPWTISIPLHRRADRDRLFEYVCQAEVEEANGAFTREAKTWYPGDGTLSERTAPAAPSPVLPVKEVANLRRAADGKPDLSGFWESQTPGANQGLEARAGGRGGGRQLIVDPPDGKLPMNEWGVAERVSRNLTERGYDDPTAHCFPPGVPRAMYVPAAMQIMQTADYVVFFHERMAWRIIPLKATKHLPDDMRLWQGDSLGHWEGDTLVIDTTNLNGKTWLNEGGEIASYAEHVVERFTPSGPESLTYEATVNDPVVYTKPWTISFQVQRKKAEMFETACHEEDRDLPRLKALKDAAKK